MAAPIHDNTDEVIQKENLPAKYLSQADFFEVNDWS
jgi:hypothetical protein